MCVVCMQDELLAGNDDVSGAPVVGTLQSARYYSQMKQVISVLLSYSVMDHSQSMQRVPRISYIFFIVL